MFRHLIIRFYDKNFHKNKFQYVAQCLLATLVLLAILVSLNALPNAVVIASIGASSFMAFTMPHRERSRTRYIIGGYLVGIIVGTVCFFAIDFPGLRSVLFLHLYYDEIFGALSVGVTMFLMVVMNLEHPPAAALALGLVLNAWSPKTILVTLIAVSLIVFFRHLLKPYLINL